MPYYPPSSAGSAPQITIPQGGASTTAVSHTGDTSETILATIVIPSIPAGAQLRVTTYWNATSSGNNKTGKIYYGATSSGIAGILYTTYTNTTLVNFMAQKVIANRTTSSQFGVGNSTLPNPFGQLSGATATSAITTTVPTEINVSGQLASAGEIITLEGYLLEIISP